MERQRHLEWEKQRIQDLQAHLQRELESVTGIRERSTALDTEYQTLVKCYGRAFHLKRFCSINKVLLI